MHFSIDFKLIKRITVWRLEVELSGKVCVWHAQDPGRLIYLPPCPFSILHTVLQNQKPRVTLHPFLS
jgi:DNA-binding sugar fermentation-stimulating protein